MSLLRKVSYIIPPAYEGKKVIHFLRGEAGLSSRLVVRLKHTPGGITLDGAPVRTIDRLPADGCLAVSIPEDGLLPEPNLIPLDILYEDEDILALNKPPGLAMHPTHNHPDGTLANAVANHLSRRGKSAAFRAVGRLDKGTSGVVVCALHPHAAYRLSGKLDKRYLAVAGGLFSGEGTIDVPICRPDPMKTLRACGEPGERAITHWQALRQFEDCTLLRLRLETGRTHQIRVHFAHLGAPLLGDEMYGGSQPEIGHPLLHCESCKFRHPITGEELALYAPPHGDFEAYVI